MARHPRPGSTKGHTKLARERLLAGLTQQEIAQLAGMSEATYRRLESGGMNNPPLRFLVNIALVLEVDLFDLVEDEWLDWMPFDQRQPEPPRARRIPRQLG